MIFLTASDVMASASDMGFVSSITRGGSGRRAPFLARNPGDRAG